MNQVLYMQRKIVPATSTDFVTPISAFDAATVAWVAAVVAAGGTVSGAREILVNNLITGLKSDGIWTKLDRLWILAAENEISALMDMVADITATKVSTPTFTIDKGYTGQDNAAPSVYLDSNYNPTINAINFLQDSAHISIWSLTDTATGLGGCTMGERGTNIFDTYLDGNIYIRINDNVESGSQGPPGSRIGHWIANRSGASASQAYQNGSLFSSPNATSGAPQNANFYILCNDASGAANGTPQQISVASIGGSLTSTDAANFHTRLGTYLTAVGN